MRQAKAVSRSAAEPWLDSLGFRFNPFQHLEASSDPRLGDYIVGHETFAVTWYDGPAVVFAPAGGGKTAMRIYTARSCWVGRGGSHPFPIPYILPRHAGVDVPITLDAHMRSIVQAGVAVLLISLAYRPERFLELDTADRRMLTAIMQIALPSPLSHYLDILRETGDPLHLSSLVDRAYILPDPAPRREVLNLCAALEDAMPSASSASSAPDLLLDQLVELLLGPLGFRSIFLLVDGVDAFPETIADPARAVDCVTALLEQAANWATQRIFLKCFLPLETETPLTRRMPDILPAIRQARLIWTPTLLAEVIRRRVYVASGGEFGSLDAVSSPALRDIETTLVRSIPLLPREALHLVSHVLFEYAHRDGGVSGQLEEVDLDAALDWYQKQQVPRAVSHLLLAS